MSEATSPLPVQAPPALEELAGTVADELRSLRAEIGAARRALDAAKLTAGRQVTDDVLMACERRIRDVQFTVMGIDERIRAAATVRSWAETFAAPQPEAAPEAAPRSRRRKGLVPGQREAGRHTLRPVRGFAPVAAFGALIKPATIALKSSWVAHPVVTAMAGGAAVVTLAATAAVIPGSVTLPFGHAGGAPNPAASIYSATPIGSAPSSLRLVGAVTRPKPALDAKPGGSSPLAGAGVVPSSYASSSSWPSQQQQEQPQEPQVQAQAGPAVLSVSSSTLDLSGALTSTTVTLSATGSGWVTWKLTTDGSDLDFSSTHGVLQAGQSATVTVSLASVLDALTQQVFSVGGQQFTVQLPLPPVPTVSPSDIVPSVVPSVLPSGD